MANIKIIDLPTGSPESTSFVEATQVDELAESGRSTVKLALNAFGNFVAGQGASPLEYGDLETESTTLIGAANELHNTIGADAYDDTATYNTGDYCIYGGELYKCNDDNVTGAWDATKWDATILVDELGAGGGASVTLGTTVPSDASGENGDLYVQYDSLTFAVVEYFVKVNNSWRIAPYSRVVALTQAQYDLITPDPTTLYIITDAQSSYQTKSDNSLDTDDKTIVGAINEVNTALSDKQDYLSLGDMVSGDDLDDFTKSGFYRAVAGVLNRPVSQYGIVEVYKITDSYILQRFTSISGTASDLGQVYQRFKLTGGWSDWYKITATLQT